MRHSHGWNRRRLLRLLPWESSTSKPFRENRMYLKGEYLPNMVFLDLFFCHAIYHKKVTNWFVLVHVRWYFNQCWYHLPSKYTNVGTWEYVCHTRCLSWILSFRWYFLWILPWNSSPWQATIGENNMFGTFLLSKPKFLEIVVEEDLFDIRRWFVVAIQSSPYIDKVFFTQESHSPKCIELRIDLPL